MNAYIVDTKQEQETWDQRLEARGQRPDPNPDPGNQSEARTDRISMYNLQKVEI